MNIADIIPVSSRNKSLLGKPKSHFGQTKDQSSNELDPVQIVNSVVRNEQNDKSHKNIKKHSGVVDDQKSCVVVEIDKIHKNKESGDFQKQKLSCKSHKKKNSVVESAKPLVVETLYVAKTNVVRNEKVRASDLCSNIDIEMFYGGSIESEFVYRNKKYKTIVHKNEDVYSDVCEDSFLYVDGEKVFDSLVYKGHGLPKWFLNITVAEIPTMLNSLEKLYVSKNFEKLSKVKTEENVSRDKKHKHVVMNENMRESYRQHKIVLSAVRDRARDAKRLVKEYLYCVFRNLDAEFSDVISSKQIPYDYVGCQMPQIYVDDFDARVCNHKKEQSQIKISTIPNMMFSKAESTSRSIAYTAASFKKRLREFAKQNYEIVLWRHYLEKHMPLPESFGHFMASDYVMWWKNLIPVEFYYLTTGDWNRFYDLLYTRLSDLRKRMYAYALRYYKISKLQHHERESVFGKRKEMFAKLMKTPRAQALFLAGKTHAEVSNVIYNECTNSIDLEIDRILKTRTEGTSYQSTRYDEYEPDDVCEPEVVSSVKPLVVKSKPVVRVRNVCSYVRLLRKPTLESTFQRLSHNDVYDNNLFSSWLLERHNFNKAVSVSDYDPIKIRKFFECETFECFLLARKYIPNLEDRIYKHAVSRAIKMQSATFPTYDNVNLKHERLKLQSQIKNRIRLESNPFALFAQNSSQTAWYDLWMAWFKKTVSFPIYLVSLTAFLYTYIVTFSVGVTQTIWQSTTGSVFAFIFNLYGLFVDCRNQSSKLINFELTLQDRLRLIEINSLIHMLYHLKNGEKAQALGWSSNFLISRYNDLPQFLHFVNEHKFEVAGAAVLAMGAVHCFGYSLDVCTYKHLCESYDKGFESVSEFCMANDTRTFETQSLSIGQFLKPFVGMFVGKEVKDLSMFEVRDLNQQWQLANHMTSQYTNLVDNLSVVVSFLLRLIFGYDICDSAQQEFVQNMMSHMLFFKETSFQKQEVLKDKNKMAAVLFKYETAVSLRQHPRYSGVPSYMTSYYDRLLAEFSGFAKEVSNLLKNTNLRKEPIVVLFTGKPKTGKSSACTFLQQALSVLINDEQYDANMTYTYNKQSEFWEGYNNNMFVLMDDIFSSNDLNDRRNEATALIGMVNISPYNLPMAFENKGTMFFSSKFIFASTNLANNGIKSAVLALGMTDSNAIKRRFHWILHALREYKGEGVQHLSFRVDGAPQEYHKLVGKEISLIDFVKLLHKQYDEAAEPHVLSVDEVYNLLNSNLQEDAPDGLIHDEFNGESKPDVSETSNDWFSYADNWQSRRKNNDSQNHSKYSTNEPDHGTTALSQSQMSFFEKYYKVFIEDNSESIFNGVKYAGYLFSILITAYGAYSLYNHYVPKDVEVESKTKKYADNSAKKGLTNKSKIAAAKVRKFKRFRDMKHKQKYSHNGKTIRMQSSVQNFEQASLKAARGSVFLYFCAKDEEGNILYRETSVGFHLKSGVIMTVAHSILRFEEYDHVEMYVKYNNKVIELDVENILILENEDACFLKMPDNTNKPPEMYKYLATYDENYHMHEGMPMMMVTSNEAGQPVFKNVNKVSGPDMTCQYCVAGNNIIVESPIYYSGYTSPGDSGSMLFMPSLQGSPILVGMHLGCQDSMLTSYKVALPIWKEFLDSVLSGFETQSNVFPLEILYEVDKDKAFFPPRKSKISRSKLYGVFGGPTFVPAHLSEFKNPKGEIIDPAHNGLLKFKQVDFKTEIPERVMTYLSTLYPQSEFRNLFTYDQAVNGCVEAGVPSIKVSTSPGYPYCLHAKKGKSTYIEFDGEKFLVDEGFMDLVNQYENELLQGKQIEVLWADVLKDETRTIEKVNAGKTRLFSTCPLHYLFLVRRYFGAFVGEVQKHSVDKPVAVGINPHSLDWERLYHRLAKVGNNDQQQISIIAGDFESYDTTLCSAFAKFFVRFVNKWYDDGPKNGKVRELLFEHVYNAKHIFGNKVYQLAMGNPSGNPLTAIYNSFCNIIATYVVLVCKMNIRESEFQMTVYGDDNVISIGRKGIRCSDLAPHYLSCFGLKYTHFSKDPNCEEPHDTLETIRYLGRKFVMQDSKLRAPLEEVVILEMVYWVRGNNAVEEKFLSTVEAFFIEMSHFGEEKFNERRKQLMGYIKEKDPQMYKVLSRQLKSYWHYWDGMYVPGKTLKFMWFESLNHMALEENFDEVFFSGSKFHTHSAKCAVELNFVKHPSKEVKLHCRNIPVNFEVKPNDEEDRDANVASDTQEGRIGTFSDVSTLHHSKSNIGSILQSPLNFEEYTVDQTLERTYQIGSHDWNESQAQDTLLGSYSFPKALFTQDFIQQRIKDYYYFKGTIRLSLRVSSSKYVYGMLMVHANPFPTSNVHDSNIYHGSGLPHVLLSASESSTVVFDIPFVSNKRALIINNHFPDEMARVGIRVVAPLRNTDGSTANATVAVFAQFLDVRVALPFSFDPQSNSNEADLKGKMNSISSKFESHIANPVKIMRQKFDKQISPFVETAEKVGRIVGTVATVASLIGLDKPVTTDRTKSITVIPDMDLMSGNGVSHAIKAAYDVDNGVSTAPISGYPGDEMNLLNIVSTPMITGIFTMVNGTQALPICPAGVQLDFSGPFRITYVDWIANQFLYTSGTFKYKIYITAGLFQAIRLVFFLCPDQFDETEWENCYHKVVDVQGDTQVDFRVPYMKPYVSESNRLPTQTPTVWVKILGWSTPNQEVSAPITLTVYKAGDMDMQFGCPLEKYITLESNPRADFALDFEFMDARMKNYKHEGIVFGEEIRSVRDIIHRLAPQYSVNAGTTFRPYLINGVGSPAKYYHLEMWGAIFKFFRGSIRVAVSGKKNTTVGCLSLKLPSIPNYAELYLPFGKMSDKNQGLMQIEIPWYSDRAYLPTVPSSYSDGHPLEVKYCSQEVGFLFKGAGDDFSFGFLLPPTTVPLPAPFTFGAAAMNTFFIT